MHADGCILRIGSAAVHVAWLEAILEDKESKVLSHLLNPSQSVRSVMWRLGGGGGGGWGWKRREGCRNKLQQPP